jgi:hypothetical protein
MSDLTRPDRGEAMARLTEKITELPDDEVSAYMILCMAFLAKNAPDVCTFIMDRVDTTLAKVEDAS